MIRRGLLLVIAAAACSEPEKELESGRRYIAIVYTDTTFESFSRTNKAVTGIVVSQGSDSLKFRIWTGADGLVSKVDLTLHPASDRGERPRTRVVPMPKGTLPLMGTSVAFLEQLLRRARAVGGDSVTIPVMLVGAQASLDVLTMIKNGSDSVVLVGADGNQAIGIHLAVDAQGRILGGGIPVSSMRIIDLDAAP